MRLAIFCVGANDTCHNSAHSAHLGLMYSGCHGPTSVLDQDEACCRGRLSEKRTGDVENVAAGYWGQENTLDDGGKSARASVCAINCVPPIANAPGYSYKLAGLSVQLNIEPLEMADQTRSKSSGHSNYPRTSRTRDRLCSRLRVIRPTYTRPTKLAPVYRAGHLEWPAN